MLLALRRPKAVSAFHVKHGGVVESLSLGVGNLRSAASPTCRGGSVSRETWKFIQLLGRRVIQLFVVAGVYGFALFENREMQTRWRAFADLAFVRVFLSYSSEIRLNHPVVFHVKPSR